MTVNTSQDTFLLDPDLLCRLEKCTNLPSPPVIAMRIIELAKDPEVDIGKVADIISMDPALTAKILRVTNSPMYALRRKTENLRQAITLLGLNGTMTLALSFSLAATMHNNADQGFDYNLYWRRSMATATCCRRLGMAIDINNGEELFLAGLLQDIGMLVLDKMDPDFYKNLDVDQSDHQQMQVREQQQLGADHAAIGGWILHRWGLPECLQYAVSGSHHPEDALIKDEYRCFTECVAVSGLLVDALPLGDDDEALPAAVAQTVQRLGIEESRLAETLELLNEDFCEVESLFETSLQDYKLSENLIDQAKEALLMRNLQAIQQTDNLMETAERLESRTQDLEEKTRRDGLTGLYNRAYLDATLKHEFEMSKKRGWSLAVMFVDLDHFKQINDTYGHQAGDEVLQNTAKLLCDGTRDDDLVARYGGEEFVIVLPGIGEKPARVVAERLMKAFRNATHDVKADEEIVVTASIGVAIMGEGNRFASTEDLVTSADKAVYVAKHEGRNRFVVYSSILEMKKYDLHYMASAG